MMFMTLLVYSAIGGTKKKKNRLTLYYKKKLQLNIRKNFAMKSSTVMKQTAL